MDLNLTTLINELQTFEGMIKSNVQRGKQMLLILPLRVRRRLVTKGRLVRKPRKGSLDGKEIYVKWKMFPLEQI